MLGAWVVVGCGNAALSGKGVSDAHEAPLVHLRAADPDRSASNPAAQSDPTPVDPAHAREVQSDAALPTANSDVSLATILAFADQHSPVLRVARSTRSRAEAARVAASVTTPSNPELTIAAGPRLVNAGTGVELELMLMQQVQIAGERGLRVAASDSLAKLTDAEIEQVRWTVHCEVHAAFHRTLVEQERARLAGAVVGFQEEVLRVVERQIAAGETAPLSLRLAQAEVAQARQVLVAAEQAFTASRIRLAELAGWSVASPPLPTSGVDSPRDPPALERLSQVAREHLPSLRTGAARIEEATSRVTLADRESWPRPALGVQYRREDNRELGGTSNLVMGVLSLPIPSFQLNQGERARARAEVNVARAELDASEQLLDGQIAEARSEVVAAAARTRAYGTEILPRFSENLTLLRRSFELGEIDILALSTGRERFLRIQSDALSAQQDYFVALSGLERVVGVDLWRDDHDEGHAQ
ncbi:MAG TPA: TolC family protein [Polyangiaceae bacterium]|nr:TolC family protein [Polyangiaceae bacterium]